MIGYLEGTVLARLEDGIVVKTAGGVGYQVRVPAALSAGMSAPETPVRLFTVTVVRDNEISLYGFADQESRTLFELSMKASGVGPKLALALLSAFDPPVLRQAIVNQDVSLLATIPGVGKKTASRLCVELADRLGEHAYSLGAGRGEAGELISALTNLGFPEKDVVPIVRQLNGEGLPFDQQFKKALGLLARH